jgi:hypothetical protein
MEGSIQPNDHEAIGAPSKIAATKGIKKEEQRGGPRIMPNIRIELRDAEYLNR